MPRKRWIQINGKLIEADSSNTPPSRTGTMIMPDIKPYQAMGVDIATGTAPIIESRSQHREYLRRNGFIEIGNEQPKLRNELRGDFNVQTELAQAVGEVLQKR